MLKKLVVITGMSGSGKSVAAKALEDTGFFCVDNLPIVLLPQLLNQLEERMERLAVVVDIRQPELSEHGRQILEQIRSSRPYAPRVLFLDSDDLTLQRRYAQSRRPHPLLGESVSGGIAAEREMLAPLREIADPIVDTSHLPPHELRRQLRKLFSNKNEDSSLQLTITSFGFKNGLPLDIDVLFDVRFLPNPYWVEELRAQSGQDAGVQEYLEQVEDTGKFLEQLKPTLLFLVRCYQNSDRHYLTIAFGCTGGQHRSVYMAEQIHAYLVEHGIMGRVVHRDMEQAVVDASSHSHASLTAISGFEVPSGGSGSLR